MMPASTSSSVRKALSVLLVISMVIGAVPAQLLLVPATASVGDGPGTSTGETRGVLPSTESFDSTAYRSIDSDNNSKRDAIEVRYTVRTTAAQEQVSVLMKAMDGDGNTVKFRYDNFTAFRFGNQQRTWTFYAYYTGYYRVSLTLYDSDDRQEDSDTSSVYYLDTGTVKRWISITTRSLDLDKDSYDDDVEVHVTNWTGKDVVGAQVWINGTSVGKTDSSGKITGRNYPKGWINIDAFWKDLHNSTSWYSEGDGSVNQGLSVRAEVWDFDGDELEDDVEVTVRNQLDLPVRNAQITINRTSYGTTDAQGQLTAFNFRRGFWIVNATKLNSFGSATFYSEGQGAGTELDEYFFDIEIEVVDVDEDDRENDLRVRVDADVEPAVKSNVTLWVNLTWANNGTAAINASSNFSIEGTKEDWHTVDIKNITYGRYWVRLVLLDSNNNTEDWYFSIIELVRPSNHINVETGVFYEDADRAMDDVLFRALRVNEAAPDIMIRLYNETGVQVRSARTNSEGRRWFYDMADGVFNWTAKDSDGRLIERGRVVIGARVQVETDLADLDFDGFYDDFRVRAYNNVDRDVNTVSVTVWAPNGTEVTSNMTLGGQRTAMNLTKGTYEFNATYLGEELVNGTFYSYGNVYETFKIHVASRAVDEDGDGRYDDLNVSVLDNDDNPMEFAKVYVDGVYRTLTGLDGSAVVKDLGWGIHTVEARYSGEVAKGVFFSEGTTAHTAGWTVLVLNREDTALSVVENQGGSTNETVFLYYCERTNARPRTARLWIVLDGTSQEVDLSRLGSAVKPGQQNNLENEGVLEAVFKFAFGHFKAQRTAALFMTTPDRDDPYDFEQRLTKAVTGVGGKVGLLSNELTGIFASFAYEVRSSFDYAMSYLSTQGYPLAAAVKRVRDQPTTNPRQLGELLVDRYAGSSKDRTILIDLSKVGPFATALDALAGDLAKAYPGEGWAIQDARNASGFPVGDTSDLVAFTDTLGDELNKALASSALRSRALAMRDAARAVELKTGSASFGWGLLFANDTDDWEHHQEFLAHSSLADDTDWDEFMREFWRFRNYGIFVNATPFDAESSGRENDVTVYVNDTYGQAIAGARVTIDLIYEGDTGTDGKLEAYNYTRGTHLVNVTWKGYAADTTFYSEGTILPNQAPAVTITEPTEGETVNRTYTVRGTATDSDGIVSYVEVRFNGSAWERATGRSSWRYEWDTTQFADGTWRIEARAYDGDLHSTLAVVNVTVHNPVVYADVLLVDDDGGEAYDVYYTQALLAAGIEFDAVSVARGDDGPDAQRLKRHKYVIWFTGEESEGTLTAADVAALSDFLDDGGGLWLTGQDIGRDLTSDGTVTSAFLRDYMKADFVTDNADDFDLIGIPDEDISNGINVSIEGGTGARNQNYPSEIQPRSGAAAVYLYNSTAEAAVKFGGTAFRTVYFAFGFEGIARAQDRNRVLEAVLDWLADTTPTDPNQPPIVNAGNDVTTMVGEPALFRGRATDPDGVVALYEWDFDGDGTYDWSNATTGVATWTYDTAGNYTAKLRAEDNIGDFATATVAVEVRPQPPNQPPVADAGDDEEVFQGDAVEFVMAGYDPDGIVVLYEWDYDGDGTWDYESPYPLLTNHTYYDVGVYEAVLRVTDDDGATGTDSRNITVKELVQNQPPVADAGPDITAEVGTVVTLVGNGVDPDGHIVLFKWDFDGDGTYDWENPSTGTAKHTYNSVGVFLARLLVRDNNDASHTDTTSVEITPVHVNEPPIADAGPDMEAVQGEEVDFRANGSDADGFIVRWEWDFDGDGTYDWNSTQKEIATWTYDMTGLFIARLQVTDNEGAQDTDIVRVSVEASVQHNEAPLADAGGPYSGVAGQELNLEGSGTDPDGTVETYQWDFEGDGTTDYTSGSSGVTAVIYDTPGVYTAVLIVTDDRGARAQDVADVVIARANEVPEVRVTHPTPGVALKGYQVFRGSASDDQAVARVEVRLDDGGWTKVTGTSSWTFDIDLETLVEGTHTLRARAIDNEGSESNTVEVQFDVVHKKKRQKDDTPGLTAPLALLAALGAALLLSSMGGRRIR